MVDQQQHGRYEQKYELKYHEYSFNNNSNVWCILVWHISIDAIIM